MIIFPVAAVVLKEERRRRGIEALRAKSVDCLARSRTRRKGRLSSGRRADSGKIEQCREV